MGVSNKTMDFPPPCRLPSSPFQACIGLRSHLYSSSSSSSRLHGLSLSLPHPSIDPYFIQDLRGVTEAPLTGDGILSIAWLPDGRLAAGIGAKWLRLYDPRESMMRSAGETPSSRGASCLCVDPRNPNLFASYARTDVRPPHFVHVGVPYSSPCSSILRP